MKRNNLQKEIFNCLWILEGRDRIKYLIAVGIQSAMSLIDLLGVATLGLVGSLAIRGVQSQPAGDRVSDVLIFLRIDALSIQEQVAILSTFAVALLTFKTVFTIYFSRKILFFLGAKSAEISTTLINRTLSKGYLGLKQNTQTEIQYATGDGVTAISLGVLGVAANLIGDLSLLLVVGLGVFVIDPFSALTTLGLFGTIGLILYFSMNRRAKKIGSEMAKLNVDGNSKLFEVVNTYREIYSRNRLNYYVQEISDIKREFAHQSARQTLLPNISKYIVELSVTVGAMMVAAIEFSTSDASRAAASLALFMAAGSRIAPALLRIQQGAIQVQGSLGLAEPTLSLLKDMAQVPLLDDNELALDFEHTGFKSEVQVSNASFKYSKTGLDIVSNISFEVHEGEMLAIVGPSGSGKSTVVDLILGVLSPTSGEITISGLRSASAIQKWPGAVGYVPQNVNLINQSIRRNLEIGFAEGIVPKINVENALRDAHLLKDDINLEDKIGEFGGNISGGQRQRVGIARALLLNPRLLVLDEATSSLDSKTEHDISATLMNLKGKISMIVVAHRLSTVKRADRIIYLDKGKILACGNFEELRAQVPEFNEQAELMGLNHNEQ